MLTFASVGTSSSTLAIRSRHIISKEVDGQMAVPAYKRSVPKLQVIIDAMELAAYTIQVTKNPKVFDPLYNTAITNDIISTAKDIYISAWTANNIMVRSDGDLYRKRREYQTNAILQCNNLLALIQLAQRIFHFRTKRLGFWASKIVGTRSILQAWKESDANRYGHLLKK